MVKIDNGGGRPRGVWPMMIYQNCQIFGRFLGISSEIKKKILIIFENFLKINNIRRTIFK
jgi:hypothetical protein